MIVLSISSPRSGSLWHYQMLNALVVADGGQDIKDIYDRYRWIFPSNAPDLTIGILYGKYLFRLALINMLSGTFAVRSHGKPTRSLRILAQYKFVRTTFIYRDPRDRLVSILNEAKKRREMGNTTRNFGRVTSFEDALEWISTSYQHYQMWKKHPDTLMVRYENLVQNTEQELRRNCDFLGLNVSDEQIVNVVNDFDKKNTDPTRIHFVRGKIGTYKSALTSEQIQQIHDVLGDDMIKMGYAID